VFLLGLTHCVSQFVFWDTERIRLFNFPQQAGHVRLAIYGMSAICWLWVLSRAPLSFVCPILALTFPIVVGASAILFSELILPLRWAGVGIIMIGLSLLALE
jgi:drug/metabolite transporter (DMT)-like permease